MAKRETRFFVTIEEAILLINEVMNHTGLHAFLYEGKKYGGFQWFENSLTIIANEPIRATSVFFTSRDLSGIMLGINEVAMGKLHSVSFKLPQIIERRLTLCAIVCVTTWWDRKTRETHDHIELLDDYKAIIQVVRKHLFKPVHYTFDEGENWIRAVPAIHYTKGVQDWERNGGVLYEERTINPRYTTLLDKEGKEII